MADQNFGYLHNAQKNNTLRSWVRQLIAILSLMVVLGVFWTLKLTGITLAGEAFCGKREHTHTEQCPTRVLICQLQEQEPHTHTEDCISQTLICQLEELEGHSHTEQCRSKVLQCTLEETEGHTHGPDCVQKALLCTLPELEGHTHGDECQEKVLTCTLQEDPGHSHTEQCRVEELICALEESEEHTHNDQCKQVTLVCGQEEQEGHTHDADSCYESRLSCTLEETEGHTHGDGCYGPEEIICGLEELAAHLHGDECYAMEEGVWTCGLEEIQGHTHGEECWQQGIGFGCGMTEAEGHIHTAQCLTEETELSCGLEATEGHLHGDECYESLEQCPLEEHIHEPSCYSNIKADLETSDDWEATFADMVRGPTVRENVVLVAQSQLGYTESTRNFQVDAFGVRRGITRYGQWYGNPYGDWSAMFVSFCLHYAGVEGVPANAGPEAMRLEWESAGLYVPAQEAGPEVGNLIFLHQEETIPQVEINPMAETAPVTETTPVAETVPVAETTPQEETTDPEAPAPLSANAVAVITGIDETSVTVIQGDLNNAVTQTQYAFDDPAILGYGLVPEAPPMMLLPALAPENAVSIAQTVAYSQDMFNENASFVLYTVSDGNYYAFDGNGNAVQIYVEGTQILSDAADPNTLLWSVTASNGAYLIQNVATGRYMHAYPNNGTGVTTSGAYTSSLIQSGTGVKVRSNSEYAKLNVSAGVFQMTQNQAEAAVYQFGMTSRCTVWLDGTDGGLGHLTGSPDTGYTVQVGSIMQLPSEWTSPSKYSYKLRGWYDITNSRYYLPGAEMEVTGNAVLYADWVAATYDIGVFNAQVADTVSTNSFITTHVFDYNYLFNLQSSRADITVNASGHTETWSMVSEGEIAQDGREAVDFIFVDNDSGGLLCIPNNRSSHNIYPGAGVVTPGVYSATIGDMLFSTNNLYDPATGTGVLGKNYLGTGDHLFQIVDDPTDEHYGYYYYDSKHNAASYNRSNRRFYVYEYLEGTSDAIGSTNSDFLPLNSPYVNTNGKTVSTYTYAGVDGEYEGVTHYRYDSKYNSGNYNSVNNVQTDYAYGMRTDIHFYLPNDPGSGGNKDLYGNDMQFQFSGDDDLWVLIDGQLVLDIGGIHGAEDGVIDFTTGEVTVQGEAQTSLMDLGITAGDHTMTILYLERGSSLSNCSIYFNLAPRFALQLQKEDVLTQQLLNGAQFSVYRDVECTEPAELWVSEEAYNNREPSTNVFTVANGTAQMWGLGSGNTYYIKETAPPAVEGYGMANGVIRVTIGREGQTTYDVAVIPDAEGNGPSNGYTVHGVKIDEETQTVYLVVTNAPETVTETTTVQVIKIWEDSAEHSGDYIQAYLTVTDPDGTVRRIREVTLSDENEWRYTWTNLPKYDYEALTEVQYGIEESYESGYYSTVRKITEIKIDKTEWAESVTLQDGEYLLRTSQGYLSTKSSTDSSLCFVNEATAKGSPLALWTADVSGSSVKLTNGAGQILTFYSSSGWWGERYYRATTASQNYQTLSIANVSTGVQLYYRSGYSNYYLGSTLSNGRLGATTSSGSALTLTPITKVTSEYIEKVEDWAYQITNTPLAADNETAVSVEKQWNIPAGYDETLYQEYAVTVRLLANGVSTGRTITLNLKNNWQGSFLGLPYTDVDGNVIIYTVEEIWDKDRWTTEYGPIETSGGTPPTYSTTITNTYYSGGPALPSTGSTAREMYILCGYGIMLGSLVYGIGSRRKRERRMK